MENIIPIIVGAAILIITAVITGYVVPMLKNKNLLGIVKTLVEAAEKLAENQPINKKEWVVAQLENLGVKITPFVDAAIESAVQQLDIAMGKAFNEAVLTLAGDIPAEKE